MAEEYDTWCDCSMIDESMMKKRWLCIPCFLLMETEANGRRLERDLSDCGEPAIPDDVRNVVGVASWSILVANSTQMPFLCMVSTSR